MAILFAVLGATYFLFIFIIRNRITVHSNRLNAKKKELAPIISNFLFHDEDNSVPDKKDYVKLKIEIREALKDASFRRVLTEILLDLQKDVSGETRKKLNELYIQLDLHHDAYKKLENWRWALVSQGILELTQMQVIDSYSFITKFINDRRGIIRKQAEVATVSLKPEGISYFLDTTRFSISEWQQLKLMEVLRGMEHFRPPAFKTWLVSGNRDVVLFALRLIRHYNQNEAASSIIELVKHKNERVKMEAIQCIKEFCIINALDTLKAVFPKTGQAAKIEILDTLATLGNEEDLEFLKKVEQNSSSFLVKNKAQMAINEIMPETFIPSKDILSEKELDSSEINEDQFDDAFLNEEINKIALAEDETETEFESDKNKVVGLDTVSEVESEFEPTVELDDIVLIEIVEVEPESLSHPDTIEVAEEIPQIQEKVKPAPESVLELEDIEVIEVFEVDSETSLENEEDQIPDSTSQPQEKGEPTFEIGLLNEELDSSINDQIGLLGNSDDESGLPLQQDLPEADHYFGMDSEEKIAFIELLEDTATDKDSLLLEELMQKEEDSEIRYRLFKTLKAIKEGINDSEPEEKGLAIDSVFHSLFEYASDLDSKLILVREISEVGDEKELPLLELLEKDENSVVKAQVEKSKKILLDRLYKTQIENNDRDEIENKTPDDIVDSANNTFTNELLPLELCFLEDNEIDSIEKQDPEIAFELTEEFYQEQERRIAIGN